MKQFFTLTFSLICFLAIPTQAQYTKINGVNVRAVGNLGVDKSIAVGGTTVAVTNTNASIDCKLATQFLLPNRGTTTQRNALTSLADGATFYNTTLKNLNVWNNTDSAWRVIPHSTGTYSLKFTTTATTELTLPTSGTLVNSAVTTLSSLTTIGTLTGLDVNADLIRVRTSKTPDSAGATGNAGEIAWDASYIYICTATNTWKRVAIATW